MGWTEEQALQTTLPVIELAYKGRCEFAGLILKAVMGEGNGAAPAEPVGRPMTPALFDAVFDHG